jgi:NAD(P)H-dependent FMN reductase
VADLAAINLPMADEPNHPRLRQYVHQHTRDWSALIDCADAVVFVTPEYNHGYPATVKNAIDFLYHRWAEKPVGFVSYGGISAGTRSVQQ